MWAETPYYQSSAELKSVFFKISHLLCQGDSTKLSPRSFFRVRQHPLALSLSPQCPRGSAPLQAEGKSLTIHLQLQPQIGRNDWVLIRAEERESMESFMEPNQHSRSKSGSAVTEYRL